MIARVPSSGLHADLDHIIAHTHDLWGQLRGESIFITGGTGFFGRWLLESFAEANARFSLGMQAVVLSRRPEAFRARAPGLAANPAIRLVRGDVKTLERAHILEQLGPVAPDRFAFVLHGASETSLPANSDDPLAVLETSIQGTRRALDFAVGIGARGFLLMSSGAVYGEQPSGLGHVPESFTGGPDVSTPLAAYGEGKRVAELLCAHYSRAYKLRCMIARCFAFVGPYLDLEAHYAIGNFIRDALAERTIAVKGDGTPLRSYLYGADLAIWLWTILLHPTASSVFNVGSDQPIAIRDVAERVARQHQPEPLDFAVAQSPNIQIPARRYVPDVSLAQRELGLQVWTTLDSAIHKTLEFHQQAGITHI